MKNLLFAFILFCSVSLHGQVPTEITDRVEFYMDIFENQNLPHGISLAINIEGIGTYESTRGYSHTPVIMEPNMVLGIGSNTKLFTSILAMKLVENGDLNLTDPISNWIPSHPHIDPNITIAQLLQHASGIDDYVDYLMPDTVVDDPSRIWTSSEILAKVGPAQFAAGTSIKYSSTNYYLLGMILEQITNQTYTSLIHDSILTPLGLTETFVEGYEPITSPIAHPWHNLVDLEPVPRIATSTVSWAAGCMVATPKNMAKWYQDLFNSNFITNNSINTITTFAAWPGRPDKMGMGVYEVKLANDTVWGHSGQTIGYNSMTYYHPKKNFSISVIFNDTYRSPKGLANAVVNVISEELTILSVAEPHSLSQNCLVYPNPSSEGAITIEAPQSQQIQTIRLLDMKGTTVRIQEGENMQKIRINTTSLPPGIYHAVVQTQTGTYHQSVVLL